MISTFQKASCGTTEMAKSVGNLSVVLHLRLFGPHNGGEGREIVMARWGMPSSSKALMDAAKKRAEKFEAKGTVKPSPPGSSWPPWRRWTHGQNLTTVASKPSVGL